MTSFMRYRRADEPVEDVYDLLWYCDGDHGWKASKGILKKPYGKHDSWTVEKSYDHNYYFSSDWRKVPEEIAEIAIRRGLFIGRPEWGGRSDHDYVVSDKGRQVLYEKIREVRAEEARPSPAVEYELDDDSLSDR